jgi:hypothetical protein
LATNRLHLDQLGLALAQAVDYNTAVLLHWHSGAADATLGANGKHLVHVDDKLLHRLQRHVAVFFVPAKHV